MLYVEAAFYRADEKAKKVRIRRCCWEPRKLSSLWENEETGRRERCSWRGLGEGEMAGSISENVANIRSNTAISNQRSIHCAYGFYKKSMLFSRTCEQLQEESSRQSFIRHASRLADTGHSCLSESFSVIWHLLGGTRLPIMRCPQPIVTMIGSVLWCLNRSGALGHRSNISTADGRKLTLILDNDIPTSLQERHMRLASGSIGDVTRRGEVACRLTPQGAMNGRDSWPAGS